LQPFTPLFGNRHLSTLAGNFWRREINEASFPTRAVLYRTAPGTRVLVHENMPAGAVRGDLILLHGLEGSSDSGYMVSMAQAALEAGYRVHRLNLRGCGQTEALTDSLYNAGLTDDVRYLLRTFHSAGHGPVGLCGYSLGANVMLKLAGELGDEARDLVASVCAVSPPIDLEACVRQLGRWENRMYEWRFVLSLRNSYRRRSLRRPDLFPLNWIQGAWSVYDFDDRVTARAFGFGGAPNYYATQSSLRFLSRIRVPTLLIQAKNDPLIPFEVFASPAVRDNPAIELLPVPSGGHLGFVSKDPPRLWLDPVLLHWIDRTWNKSSREAVSSF
jgi:uncharacterized protein